MQLYWFDIVDDRIICVQLCIKNYTELYTTATFRFPSLALASRFRQGRSAVLYGPVAGPGQGLCIHEVYGDETTDDFDCHPSGHGPITVTAAISDPMRVGTIDVDRKTDPGTVTIAVEAGKRYKIAAQVTDERGGWEPVIWKEEDVK